VKYSVAMSSGGAPSGDTQAPGTLGPALKLALPIVVILVIVAGVTLLLTGGSSKPVLPGNASSAQTSAYQGATVSPAVPAPPLNSLRNYDGTSFNLGADRGKAVFVTFLYTHCPDVCPLIASNLHNAYAKMSAAQRHETAIVAVSVDPHGDTAANVRAFVAEHQLTGESKYLIGAVKPLARVWSAWKVGSEEDASKPELINHSALIYGISAKGRLTTIYPANFAPEQVVHDVAPLLAR
jgi:protein SCO1